MFSARVVLSQLTVLARPPLLRVHEVPNGVLMDLVRDDEFLMFAAVAAALLPLWCRLPPAACAIHLCDDNVVRVCM
jgi:hypothetical protein